MLTKQLADFRYTKTWHWSEMEEIEKEKIEISFGKKKIKT